MSAMADARDKDKILRSLTQCENQSATIGEIQEITGVPRNNLHMTLRSLKRNGRVKEDKGTWTVIEGGGSPQHPGAQDLERRVLEYLQSHPSSHKAIDIAKHLNVRTKKPVNQVLYKLEKSKKVQGDKSGKVPLWSFSGVRRPGVTMFNPTDKDINAPGAYAGSSGHNFSNRNVDQSSGCSYGQSNAPAGGGVGFGGYNRYYNRNDNAYGGERNFPSGTGRGGNRTVNQQSWHGCGQRSAPYDGGSRGTPRGERNRGRGGGRFQRSRPGRGRNAGRGQMSPDYLQQQGQHTGYSHSGSRMQRGGDSFLRGNGLRGRGSPQENSVGSQRPRPLNLQGGNHAGDQGQRSQNSPSQHQSSSSEFNNTMDTAAEMDDTLDLVSGGTEETACSSSAVQASSIALNSVPSSTVTESQGTAEDIVQRESSLDEEEYEEYGEDEDMKYRMHDMMGGDLGHLGYNDDYDMMEEMYDFGPNAVLLEMNSNPGAFRSCLGLAMVLNVVEEDVKEVLEECSSNGFVEQNSDGDSEWRLTEAGKARVKELMEAMNDEYEDEEMDEEMDDSPPSPPPPVSHQGPSPPAPVTSHGGPPPSPRELIKSNSVFGAGCTNHPASSGPPAGVKVSSHTPGPGGRGIAALADDFDRVVVKGAHDIQDVETSQFSTVKGTFDVQVLEAVQHSSSSQPTSVTSTVTSATVKQEGGQPAGGFNDNGVYGDASQQLSTTSSSETLPVKEEIGWYPLYSVASPKKSDSQQPKPSISYASPEQWGFSSSTHGSGPTTTSAHFGMPPSADFHSMQTTAQLHRTAFGSMPHVNTAGASGPMVSSRLQNAIPAPGPLGQEGLVYVPAPVSQKGPTSQGFQVGSGQGFHLPATPMQLLGKTETSIKCVSLDSGMIPRSQSQPVFGSGLTSLPAGIGDGHNSNLQITSESFAALNKNPISALMEYAQSRRMQAIIEVVKQSGPSHRPVFVMAAKVGTRYFPGVSCNNKKDGRKEAADLALRTLIAEGQYSVSAPSPSVTVPAENMTHFDKVAALTHQTFNSLIASIPENLAGRKVIAGLVMKRNQDDVGIVISIGTGNRCITGDQLSLEGNTVNDSHAEVITRRGFMRFLYQQLLTYEAGKSHDLFEVGSSGRLRMKPKITFHLYISTAPCGDGALFSPRDVESNSGLLPDVNKREHHPTFTNNVQGLLRTKMEGGEGTIPIDASDITVQTWDGVVRGERLRTMSCTDKICRWNVLGMQGALLSHFVEPVYLDSLTLGFLYDHGHLSRAVCCRLDRGDPPLNSNLPHGFHLNHPWLGRVTACQPLRETQKTKAFSINWTIGDQKPEVLDGTSGHCYTVVEKKLFSRVAKRCMYDSFKQVATHLQRPDLLQTGSYRNTKIAAKDFQAAKTILMNRFKQTGCGAWVKKPVEEEMFS